MFSARASDQDLQYPDKAGAQSTRDANKQSVDDMTSEEKKAFVERILIEKDVVDSREWNFPKPAYEYAKMCEHELGVPPKIDLSESVEILLYVNGVQKYGNLGRSCAQAN